MDDHQHKIRDWVYFTKAERTGIKVLGIGILAVLLFLAYLKYDASKKSVQDDEAVQAMIALALEAQRDAVEDTQKSYINNNDKTTGPTIALKSTDKAVLFEFNPNTASKADLKLLGLSDFAINNLIKFRNSGTIFRSEPDLGRVYGLSAEKLAELSPYIRFEEAEIVFENSYVDKKQPSTILVSNGNPSIAISSDDSISNEFIGDAHRVITTAKVDLNTVNIVDLMKVNGIGEYYGQKILKYRDNLGGFHSIDQLAPLFGNRPELYLQIKDNVIAKGPVKKLDIKNLSFSDLLSHYYVDFEIASYLKNHTKFRDTLSIDDLKRDTFLDQSKVKWLIPYLITK